MIAGACVVLAAGSAAADVDGARLLPSASGSIHFIVDVPPLTLEPVAGGDAASGAVRPTLAGFDNEGAPGAASMPRRIILVAVPPTGTVSLRASALGEERRDGVLVAAPDGSPVAPSKSPGPQSVSGAVSTPGARLLDVSWMRNQRVARIAIDPVAYDAGTRRLDVRHTIDVQVQVDGAVAATTPAEARDPFETVYAGTLLNYEQGRAWRRPASRAGPARSVVGTRSTGTAPSLEAGPFDAAVVPDTSIFVGRRWIKIAIARSGFYRVRFSQFRRLAPFNDDTTTAIDSLRLMTWPGLPVLPENSYCDTCDYHEVAISVLDAGDGKLNANDDAIVFYALGASDWANAYDLAQPDTVFVNHPYETRNYYYLGISTAAQPIAGPFRRIRTRAVPVQVDGNEATPTTFPERVHREQDVLYDANAAPLSPSTYFWEKWFWAKMSLGRSFSSTVDAVGADVTQPARIRARVWSFFVDRCGSFAPQAIDGRWNSFGLGRYTWRGFNGFTIDSPLPNLLTAGNSLGLDATITACGNDLGVAWYDLFYRRMFVPVADTLEFRSPGYGPVIYDLGPFSTATPPRLFDLTDPTGPVELQQFAYAAGAGGNHLKFEANEAGPARYRAMPDGPITEVATQSVFSAPPTSLDNLRSSSRHAKYLVIYYDGFQVAADTLAAWRRAHQGWDATIVPISAIYDQFSGGRTDPAAIRNFLRAAAVHWSVVPGYVTFLGDASYDFKNILGYAALGQPGALLPTYENGFDESVVRHYTTDDWLLNVDNPTVVVPDFLGGRIPTRDAATAMEVVRDKVLRYERTAPFGEYRNRIMLIADDQEQGDTDDLLHWTHLAQTVDLDTSATPGHMDRKRIYLHLYQQGDRWDVTKQDIINAINGDGVSVMNFIGHGSPFKISDESVFLDNDSDALNNADKLLAFFAASCDVGKFNDPIYRSLGERMLTRVGGGAVAVISATELAYSGQNAALNKSIFKRMFSRDTVGTYHYTLSEALLTGKLGSDNNQKYQLMGDAATRLNLPHYWLELKVKTEQGRDTTTVVQGQRMAFTGRLLDRPGGNVVPLDGSVSLLIEDAAPIVQAPGCPLFPGCPRPYYVFDAGAIFRGDVILTQGACQGQFVVPLEARPGRLARIRAYLVAHHPGGGIAAFDGAGSDTLIVAQGSAPGNDHTGPTLGLSFPNGATRVRPTETLRVDLSDPSGILITGHTAQNGIVVTVDDNTTLRSEITSTFRYSPDSYQSGTASYALGNLREGHHRISVSAADNLAIGFAAAEHRSTAEIEFDVQNTPPLSIRSAYLFPNPTASKGGYTGGQFVLDTEGGPVNVLVRIYTISGRLIRVLKSFGGNGQVQVPWDGLDDEGQALANGTYLFKVHANPRDADGSSNALQKAESEGRIVIVNP